MRQPIPALICLLACGLALRGDTALSKAAIDGQLARMQALAEAGTDLNGLDKWGWTALHWALFYNQGVAVRWLIAKGADPNKPSVEKFRFFAPGTTPLMVAAYNADEETVALLLAAKADPALANAKGEKAVKFAQDVSATDCVALLEGRGKAPTGTALHTRAHRLVPGKASPVLIVLSSEGEGRGPFLDRLERGLQDALAKRGVQAAFHKHTALTLDEDKSLAAAAQSVQAKYLLTVIEAKATLLKHREGFLDPKLDPTVLHATYRVSLKALDAPAVLWEREVSIRDSKEYGPFGPKKDADQVLAGTLLAELETDDLI